MPPKQIFILSPDPNVRSSLTDLVLLKWADAECQAGEVGTPSTPKPDLLLVHQTGVLGLSSAKKWRDKVPPDWHEVPWVALLSFADAHSKRFVFGDKALDYLTVPVVAEELMRLKQSLNGQPALSPAAKAIPAKTPPKPAAAVAVNVAASAKDSETLAFSHQVAHDLKNPMSTILGSLEILLDSGVEFSPDETLDLLRMVDNSSRRLLNIIDEMLVLADLQQHGSLQPTASDMMQCLKEAHRRLKGMLDESKVSLIIPDEMPEAPGPANWLIQVWSSLIAQVINAGGHRGQIATGWDERRGGAQCFWVAGLLPSSMNELQTALNEPIPPAGLVRAKGTGLGLWFPRTIVERLGGELAVVDTHRGKARFEFHFDKVR